MKKGMELPINMLVIITVAIIILMGIIAMYVLGTGPFTASIGIESIKNTACAELQRANCGIQSETIGISFDANNDGKVAPGAGKAIPANGVGDDFEWGAANTVNTLDNLAALCKYRYSKTGENACKALCSCPGYY